MLTIEEVRERLADRNLKEVARRTGIGYANLHAIATGRRENPSYKVMIKICKYLAEQNA